MSPGHCARRRCCTWSSSLLAASVLPVLPVAGLLLVVDAGAADEAGNTGARGCTAAPERARFVLTLLGACCRARCPGSGCSVSCRALGVPVGAGAGAIAAAVRERCPAAAAAAAGMRVPCTSTPWDGVSSCTGVDAVLRCLRCMLAAAALRLPLAEGTVGMGSLTCAPSYAAVSSDSSS